MSSVILDAISNFVFFIFFFIEVIEIISDV